MRRRLEKAQSPGDFRMRNLILAAMLATTAACTPPASDNNAAETNSAATAEGYDLEAQRAKFARVEMKPDTSFLNEEERQVVNYLIQAADLMTPIYLRQAFANNPQLRQTIEQSDDPNKAMMLDMF